ncbi:hypothetical protein ACWCQK_28525 [Streptomyces sp. NPDC002306]
MTFNGGTLATGRRRATETPATMTVATRSRQRGRQIDGLRPGHRHTAFLSAVHLDVDVSQNCRDPLITREEKTVDLSPAPSHSMVSEVEQ